MTRPWLIGLTGPTGSGKSTVLEWTAARGASVLDADRLVHGILEQDKEVIGQVGAAFPNVFTPDGRVDRSALAASVFGHAEPLARLESIVHPAVGRAMLAWVAGCEAEIAVVEGIKLVEAGFHRHCDSIWLTMCDRDVRRLRLRVRGWTEPDVERRIASAPALQPELAEADVIIDNSGAWVATESQLGVAWAAEVARRHLQKDNAQ